MLSIDVQKIFITIRFTFTVQELGPTSDIPLAGSTCRMPVWGTSRVAEKDSSKTERLRHNVVRPNSSIFSVMLVDQSEGNLTVADSDRASRD